MNLRLCTLIAVLLTVCCGYLVAHEIDQGFYVDKMTFPDECSSKVPIETLKQWAEKGHPFAQFNLGVRYEDGRDVPKSDEEAVKWFRKAAEQGVAEGQYNLGFMYANGRGVSLSYDEAVKWHRKAAEQGNAWGQINLGFMYEHGRGVPQSREDAINWYRKSAQQGNEKAKKALERLGVNL